MKGHNMTEIDSKQKCISCKFFLGGHILGECHRFPQSISKHENDWCGEYSKNINYVAQIQPIFNTFDDERLTDVVKGTEITTNVAVENISWSNAYPKGAEEVIVKAKKRGRPARAA